MTNEEKAREWFVQQLRSDFPGWFGAEALAIVERIITNAATAIVSAVQAKGIAMRDLMSEILQEKRGPLIIHGGIEHRRDSPCRFCDGYADMPEPPR